MSSASRVPGDKPEADESPVSKRPASPGRYSLSTEGSTEMAAVRIDSTRTMAAVRPEAVAAAAAAAAAAPEEAAPGSVAPPLSSTVTPPPPPLPKAPPLHPITVPPPSGAPPPMPEGRRGTLPQGVNAITPPPFSRGGSRRPPPPAKRDSVAPPAAATFEGFDEGSIAAAFDELLSEGTTGLAGKDTHVDLAPVRELFAGLAANHMRHVRDFMIDVKWGEAPREWIEICIPAVASLRRAGERLGLDELAAGLDRFAVELRSASSSPVRTIEGNTKERLLESYGLLVTVLPQAFALDRDKSQREAVIIQSLCLSVPDVRKVTIDKLHAAGLTSLKTLFDAKPEEISQVAGIPEALALRIVERFQAYRRELQNASPQDARAAERERLAALTITLREQHDGYEEAARGWSPQAKAKKRDLFRLREETWLAVSLLLARFGELERIQGIERVPFAQRITQLTEYLEEARQKYRSE